MGLPQGLVKFYCMQEKSSRDMQTCPELLLGPCKYFQCMGLLKCVQGLVSSQSPGVWGKQGQQLS